MRKLFRYRNFCLIQRVEVFMKHEIRDFGNDGKVVNLLIHNSHASLFDWCWANQTFYGNELFSHSWLWLTSSKRKAKTQFKWRDVVAPSDLHTCDWVTDLRQQLCGKAALSFEIPCWFSTISRQEKFPDLIKLSSMLMITKTNKQLARRIKRSSLNSIDLQTKNYKLFKTIIVTDLAQFINIFHRVTTRSHVLARWRYGKYIWANDLLEMKLILLKENDKQIFFSDETEIIKIKNNIASLRGEWIHERNFLSTA